MSKKYPKERRTTTAGERPMTELRIESVEPTGRLFAVINEHGVRVFTGNKDDGMREHARIAREAVLG